MAHQPGQHHLVGRGAGLLRHRERKLLDGLSDNDKRQLTKLLGKLVASLEAERGR